MTDFFECDLSPAFLCLNEKLEPEIRRDAVMKNWMPRKAGGGFSCACDPFAPFLWRWRIPLLPDDPGWLLSGMLPYLSPMKSAFAEMRKGDARPKALFCGKTEAALREICPECPCAGKTPVFDGALSGALFRNPSFHHVPACALSRLCGEWAGKIMTYNEMERALSYKRGKLVSLARFIDGLPKGLPRRAALLEQARDYADFAQIRRLIAGMELAEKPSGVIITGDRRRFSSDWEKKWDMFYNRLPVADDRDGPLRGCLNLDTGLYGEMIAAFRAIAARKLDGRASAFELVKIRYPDGMPDRASMLEDMETVLEKYGMTGHPAMWAVSRKKGEAYALRMCVCRVDRFTGKIPAGIVVERDLRANGSSFRVNAEGCRQAAAAALNERHGYGQGGGSHDRNGRRIAPATPERHNTWTS